LQNKLSKKCYTSMYRNQADVALFTPTFKQLFTEYNRYYVVKLYVSIWFMYFPNDWYTTGWQWMVI